jgi:hypothetical protein
MSKQTSVEWLIEQIKEYDFSPRDNTYLIEIPSWILTKKIVQAKEMEKEQIEDAHEIGYINGGNSKKVNGEQYYKQTYESQDERNIK